MSEIFYTNDGSIVHLGDTDGDGYEETTFVDENRDGEVDAQFIDTDGDGYDDTALFDNSPGDENFQWDVVAYDYDGDGRAELVLDDVDFDGSPDTTVDVHGAHLGDANPYGPDLQDALDEVYAAL